MKLIKQHENNVIKFLLYITTTIIFIFLTISTALANETISNNKQNKTVIDNTYTTNIPPDVTADEIDKLTSNLFSENGQNIISETVKKADKTIFGGKISNFISSFEKFLTNILNNATKAIFGEK